MPVPKKKKYRAHRGARRAHDKRDIPTSTVVPETGEFTLPHRVSASGWYKGRKIFKTKAELKAEKAT